MNLQKIIEEEIKLSKIPLKFEILIHPKNKNSYFVQITLDKKEIKNHLPSNSYLDFWYNKEKNYIEHINLKINEEFKGNGYGRKIVHSLENIGRKLNCSKCLIYININESFWKHLGYKKIDDTWEKELL